MTGKSFPAFPTHAHPRFCVSGKRPMVLNLCQETSKCIRIFYHFSAPDWRMWLKSFPKKKLGGVSLQRRSSKYGIPFIKIRRSLQCLIFIMGVPILVRRHLYIETVPSPYHRANNMAANALATQGTRVLAALLLVQSFRITPVQHHKE